MEWPWCGCMNASRVLRYYWTFFHIVHRFFRKQFSSAQGGPVPCEHEVNPIQNWNSSIEVQRMKCMTFLLINKITTHFHCVYLSTAIIITNVFWLPFRFIVVFCRHMHLQCIRFSETFITMLTLPLLKTLVFPFVRFITCLLDKFFRTKITSIIIHKWIWFGAFLFRWIFTFRSCWLRRQLW